MKADTEVPPASSLAQGLVSRAQAASPTPPPLRAYPTRLIVETTSRCNLQCAMCVKQSSGAVPTDGDLDAGTFQALAPAFPHLESLVLNGVGEPLLHRSLEAFIRIARSAMPPHGSIGFQTNGILLDRRRAFGLLEAGLDRASVSVDALDPKLLRELRAGDSLESVERAFASLLHAKIEANRPDFRIGMEFVAMRPNLAQLPALVEWAARRGISFILVSHLFPYDKTSLPLAAWDANLDLAVELLVKYREKGRAAGVDIGSYGRVYMKYAKSSEDERIVGLVGDMHAEAIEMGITLNIEKLLAADLGLFEETKRAFAEARRIALREGVDISLPEALPRRVRSCDFVESGAAFVSWDGKVHPCYFLWHRYACYIGGIEKRVAPKVFGRLAGPGGAGPLEAGIAAGHAERDILDIWNDPAFTTFRRNVTRYEYPYCFNCNLALCDYVQLEDSEQDCHINAEPCAACMWCLGIFNCMT
ncbi:MAG TPA: radical SAM/SPASM family putative metalloenzyme maturase [Rectinemataceae bacterium]|nr:radical SAM/SPASM family putative metalloenzyme maturase [Rectinemataceae bacterium]